MLQRPNPLLLRQAQARPHPPKNTEKIGRVYRRRSHTGRNWRLLIYPLFAKMTP